TKSKIATAASNGSIVIWDIENGRSKIDQKIDDHKRAVNRICFSPLQGSSLLSASQDCTMKLWDLRDLERAMNTFQGRCEGVRDVQFNSMNQYEFAAAFDNGTIQKWDIRKPVVHLRKYNAHIGSVLSIDWSFDGRIIASGGRDKIIRIWDMNSESRKPKDTIYTMSGISYIRWRPNYPNEIASCSSLTDVRVFVWNVKRPYIASCFFETHEEVPTGILWHDPDVLWSCSKDKYFIQQYIKGSRRPLDLLSKCGIGWSVYDQLAFTVDKSNNNNDIIDDHRNIRQPLNNQIKKMQRRISPGAIDSSNEGYYKLQQKTGMAHFKAFDYRAFSYLAGNYMISSQNIWEACEHNAKIAHVGFNNRAGFNNGAGFNNNNNEAGFNNGAGLRNDNNVVCFINSILQVLVHLPNAERHLESTGNHQCYCSPVCIFNELKRLRIKLMESRQPVYAGPFITYLTDIEPFAEVNEQNDAFLYLCGILQKVGECVNENMIAQHMYYDFWTTLQKKITCQNCKRETLSTESVVTISAATKNSIEECFDEYCESAELPGFKCSCNKFTCNQEFTIKEEPNTLIVQLKRFGFSSSTKQGYKISKRVEFGEGKNVRYNLSAVLVHEGGTLRKGHYYSYIKNRNNEWYLYNDRYVQRVPINSVLECKPYVLFYTKITPTFPASTPSSTSKINDKRDRDEKTNLYESNERIKTKSTSSTSSTNDKRDKDEKTDLYESNERIKTKSPPPTSKINDKRDKDEKTDLYESNEMTKTKSPSSTSKINDKRDKYEKTTLYDSNKMIKTKSPSSTPKINDKHDRDEKTDLYESNEMIKTKSPSSASKINDKRYKYEKTNLYDSSEMIKTKSPPPTSKINDKRDRDEKTTLYDSSEKIKTKSPSSTSKINDKRDKYEKTDLY
ncbi:1588_t:CDS:10, partial [Entrophospora sp. SA101]